MDDCMIHPIEFSRPGPKPRPRLRLRSSRSSPSPGPTLYYHAWKHDTTSATPRLSLAVSRCSVMHKGTRLPAQCQCLPMPRFALPNKRIHDSIHHAPCGSACTWAHEEHTPPKGPKETTTTTTLVPYNSITVTALARPQGINGYAPSLECPRMAGRLLGTSNQNLKDLRT